MDEKEIRKRLAGRAAEYMMFRDDEEENAKTTAEVSSSGNVIVFPDFEKLKSEVEKIRTELSMLLLERDELQFVICKNIVQEFGMRIYSNHIVYIERFAAGGMSSGVVGEEFVRQGWYELRRRNRLYRSDEVASDTLYLDKVKERIAWYCDTRSTFEYKLNPDFDSNSFLFAFEDNNMNEHQREIVAQLWGLYSGKPKSKKEVAEDMGVTYNRIRQVEICCLRHILRNRNRNTLIIEK